MKRKRSALSPRIKRVRDRSILLLVDALMWIVPRLPLEATVWLAWILGWLASKIPGRRRRRVMQHIECAFPSPEYDEAYRHRVHVASWQSLAAWGIESLWLPAWKHERDDRRIRIADPEGFQRLLATARERGTGLVVFASHLGTIEMLAHWFPKFVGVPVMCTAARPKNPELEKRTRKLRESGGLKLVYRGEAGVATMRHLRAGGVLLMLVDHNLEGPGVAVPFFGKPAHTLLAPARLALQCGATAVTMFCLREAPGKYRIDADEPMLLEPPPRDEQARFKAEAALVAEYTRRIEAAIRRNPEQYLWMHKRWEKRSDTLPLPPSD
ncbi:hypothetical protein GC173_06385 [bacterium]|nr:hypothetical protein [bacterium]